MLKVFKNLYNYRELLKTNVKKEIRGKYKNSFLGVIWSFLNPLLQIAVYAIVFQMILKNPQENYDGHFSQLLFQDQHLLWWKMETY